ncbi:MAG: flagellar basal body-associated FliL family protein [Shimia sp.]|uniref:flagellar basal body-associated FliL family protein n=1 Tax=Shimia sp. TaxID=1954381 RepID=UPI001B06F0A0|nr:flagellar basal body-associated FliL family protein [Shimia sp.]MBO6898094.1 flagellar basal body-associated FliL family protein [Shimia sp.]
MADDDEPKKKSGILKILIFVVGGLVVLGIGLGAGYVLFGSKPDSPEQLAASIIERNGKAPAQSEEEDAEGGEGESRPTPEKVTKESPKDEVFQTLYYEIPGTMTTNLRDSRRFLQIGVGISTRYDDEILRNVEANLPAIKAAILATLSGYGEEDVIGLDARKAMSMELAKVINEELELLEGFGGVESVLLTSFVMQ